MSKWDDEYQSRLRPIDEAIQCIESGFDVVVAQCASEPQATMSRLHTLAPRVRDVRVFSVLTMKPY
ncbi:MAG: 4-hydroxybutyrate--acetyl-CoA CoA transferase, partial [Spirochaetes bacterium]|nr:4-hydroxybutyrate--acetyl-CoA CoA transferase [Spirochaetota bacterium]